jgi:superfamily II DNA or RNA helicase
MTDCVIQESPELDLIIPENVEGTMRLRLYQVEAVTAAFAAWRHHSATMMVVATGLGKTVIAADIVNRWPPDEGRILVIAHIAELITQAQDKIHLHTADKPVIEMGQNRGETERHELWAKSKVVVASIQSLHLRHEQFNPQEFGLIIVDEFHHAASPSYRKVIEYFRAGSPKIKLLGITATPHRGDNVTLGCIAETCCYEMGIQQGIDEGYLVPIQQQYIVVDQLDFSPCRSLAKDLNERDLEVAMMGAKLTSAMAEEERLAALEQQERMLHAIAVPTVKEAQGRPTLVFCVTIAHAERLAEVLRRYPGVTAEVIHGKTPPDQRAEIVERFKRCELQMLVGVGCFTEGFDAPNVAVVAMARPTKQQGLYVQMIGRGTRPLPGVVDRYSTAEERKEAIANSLKSNMTVLDFVGNSGKHKLISTADVLAGDMPPELVEAAVEKMKRTGEAKNIRDAVRQKQEDRDAEERKKEEERQQKLRAQALDEEARRAKLKADAQYRAMTVDPFSTQVVPERAQSPFLGGASDRQIGFLGKLGIKEEVAMKWSKRQAGAVIQDRANRIGGEWIMRFGKHVGKPLKEIPREYLRFLNENCDDEAVQANLQQYRREYKAEQIDFPFGANAQ